MITVTGQPGMAPSDLEVPVDIKHTYRGDLVIDLVAPYGSTYRLKNSSSADAADNALETYIVDASSESADGVWGLRVRDLFTSDVGFIDSWSLGFSLDSTSTAVDSSANPSQFGEAVTFNATVTSPAGSPSGTVTFRDDGAVMTGCDDVALDASRQAMCTATGLAVGTHPITATYNGGSGYEASVGTFSQVVELATADLTVSLVDSADPVALGDRFTYTLTVENAGLGAADATSASLAFSGSSVSVLSASSPAGNCTVGATVTCSLGTIEAGGSATVVIRIEPNGTGTITATATVASNDDTTPADNTAAQTTTVDNGHGCTILGTAGNDTINGTLGADVICAFGGDDVAKGGNGNDVIYAGSGNDRSQGEGLLGFLLDNGSDTIYGGPGDDVLDGGNGSDTLVDTEGIDVMSGGTGNDTIVTATRLGGDTADGGSGTNTCTTDPNDTRLGC